MDNVELLASGVTDWHVDLADPGKSVIFPGPKVVPDELSEFAMRLADAIRSEYERITPRRRSFVVMTNDTRYRIQYMHADRFAARTLQSRVFDLYEDLNLQKVYCDMLAKAELRRTGGLVLIVGNTGSGKTTTAASTVAARLKNLGGYCLTVEEPPEYPLAGFHGKGFCEQLDASNEKMEQRLADAVRCFPSHEPAMMFFGEVSERGGAAVLLRKSVDSHLVFSTMHASSIPNAVQRLISLAQADGETNAKSLLANSIKLIIHQRLDNRVPQLTALEVNEQTQKVMPIIERGDLGPLREEVNRQHGLIKNSVQNRARDT